MDDVAEIALGDVREHPAPRPALPFAAHEQLADGGVEAIVAARQIPGPPAGMVGVGLVADQGVKGHGRVSGWKRRDGQVAEARFAGRSA
jgi:hypothetical protein